MRHLLRTIPALSALCLAAAPAAAQCVVTPGPDGELSSWLVHDGGRVSVPPRPSLRASLERALNAGESALRALPERGDPSLWAPRGDGRDERRPQRGAATAGPGRGLGRRLARGSSTAGRRWLSIGTDDSTEVYLDGTPVFRRVAVRASRADDDLVPLTLSPGAHSLVIKIASRGDMDALLRLVGADHRPDEGVRVELPGVTDAECESLSDRALAVDAHRGVAPEGLRVTLALSWPGGVAHPLGRGALPLEVTGGSGPAARSRSQAPSVSPLDAVVAMPRRCGGALQVRVGAARSHDRRLPSPARGARAAKGLV